MFSTKRLQKLAAGAFVSELMNRFRARQLGQAQPGWNPRDFPASLRTSQVETGPTLALYSAHDTTVAAVLSALGLFNG